MRHLASQTPEPVDEAAASGAQAIDRALRILSTFAPNRPNQSLKEICNQTELAPSTVRRMLGALQRSGFIRRAADGTYGLGPALVRLSRVAATDTNPSKLSALSYPHLERLRNVTGETAGLHMPSALGRTCVVEAESQNMMRMAAGVGTEFPWHAGAASKALLSAMSPPQRAAKLADTDWDTVAGGTERERALLADIAEAADRGYATSMGETVEGASAIAVPILGPDLQVVAAVNVTGPAVRWTKERMLDALPELQRTVKDIERELGTERASGAGPGSDGQQHG